MTSFTGPHRGQCAARGTPGYHQCFKQELEASRSAPWMPSRTPRPRQGNPGMEPVRPRSSVATPPQRWWAAGATGTRSRPGTIPSSSHRRSMAGNVWRSGHSNGRDIQPTWACRTVGSPGEWLTGHAARRKVAHGMHAVHQWTAIVFSRRAPAPRTASLTRRPDRDHPCTMLSGGTGRRPCPARPPSRAGPWRCHPPVAPQDWSCGHRPDLHRR